MPFRFLLKRTTMKQINRRAVGIPFPIVNLQYNRTSDLKGKLQKMTPKLKKERSQKEIKRTLLLINISSSVNKGRCEGKDRIEHKPGQSYSVRSEIPKPKYSLLDNCKV